MASAHALQASPHWLRSGGRNHFFVSTGFNHPATLFARMSPLSKLLRCSAVGRYKQFLFGYKRSAKSAVGICAIEMINRRERWSELRFEGRGREIPGAWRRITAQIASHGLKPEIGDCEATLKNIVSMCVEVRFEQRKG